MKQTISLTEGDLHRIIKNCINEAISTIKDPSLKKGMNLGSEEEYEEYDDGSHHYKNCFVDIKHSKPYIDAITDITSFGVNMIENFFEKYQHYYKRMDVKEKKQLDNLMSGWAGNGDMFKQLQRFKEWMENCYDEVNDPINFYA